MGGFKSLLQSTLLRPSHGLSQQLFTSFGTAALLSLLLVLLATTLTIQTSGDATQSTARAELRHQATLNLGRGSRYTAESIANKFKNLEGAVGLIREVALDRYVGYPDAAGYASDTLTPFKDVTSDTQVYPISPAEGSSMLLEYQVRQWW